MALAPGFSPYDLLYEWAKENGMYLELTVKPALKGFGRVITPPSLGVLRVMADKKIVKEVDVSGGLQDAAGRLRKQFN